MHARRGGALGVALLALVLGGPAAARAGAAVATGAAASIALPGVVVLDIRLFKSGSGSGRITSDPPYLDCGVSCETSLESGEKLVLIADPDPGSRFSKWTGFCAGQGSRCTFTLTVDVTTTAVFTKVIRATPRPTPVPTAAPTGTPSPTLEPTPTIEPTTALSTPSGPTPAPTPEPTAVAEPAGADRGTGPVVLGLALLLVVLLGGLGVALFRGRPKDVLG
jgi:hypothetical protein